jgi:ribosomal protein S7
VIIVRRAAVTPSELYAILDREFRKARKTGCATCKMPLPYRITRANAEAANWLIGTPDQCPNGCHTMIAELAVRLMAKYDLEGPGMHAQDDQGRRLH